MCLILKNKESKIATKDIICYKRGIVNWGNFSPYYFDHYKYEKGEKQKEIKLQPELEYPEVLAKENSLINNWTIERGYHSYIHFQSCSNHVFIIPKGSEYYIGQFNSKQENSMASSNIIWVGHKWNPITWLKLIFK